MTSGLHLALGMAWGTLAWLYPASFCEVFLSIPPHSERLKMHEDVQFSSKNLCQGHLIQREVVW